nr:MAG TPA: hypothetical protein [Caudoviricetes sp.]
MNFLPYNREERISRGVNGPLNSKDNKMPMNIGTRAAGLKSWAGLSC